MQELKHALMQMLSKHLQGEILDDQGDVAGDAVMSLLEEGDTRLQGEA